MMATMRRWLPAAALLPLILAACTSSPARPGTSTAGRAAGPRPAASGRLAAIRHVWVIELENQGYPQSFGTPRADPYLARTLPRMGALLENYYAIGHASAANYIAQISGQAPNLATRSDWATYLPDMGNDPARDTAASTARGPACGHPATWTLDHTHRAGPADQ